MERLAEKGEFRRIYEKWNIWNEHQERLFAKEGVRTTSSTRPVGCGPCAAIFPLLLQGALVTVELTFTSMFLAMALGLPIALLRLYGPAAAAAGRRWSTSSSSAAFPCSCYSISSTTGCR